MLTLNNYDFYYLIFLVKVLRLGKGARLFSPEYFNGLIKASYDRERSYVIKNTDVFDPIIDHNKI